MSHARILVIDDEPDFQRLVNEILTQEGFQVSQAVDGTRGLAQARAARPDLILLDWNLPDTNGLDVCRALRDDATTQNIPIIMLTVRGRETDTVLALGMGADDYISKRALRARELVARVQAALRRGRPPAPRGETLTVGDLCLDVLRRRVTLAGRPVTLRTKEFDLLYEFLKRPGHVLSRDYLVEKVWGVEYFGSSRALDTTLVRLRARLGQFSRRIQTIKNIGYKLCEEEIKGSL